MSLVTNVMLHHGILDTHLRPDVEAVDLGEGQTLRSLTTNIEAESLGVKGRAHPGDFWGGHKWPETDVYGAAVNYFRQDEATDALAALPWKYPQEVQLFIQGQEDEVFSLYMLRDGTFVQVWPGEAQE